MNTYILIFYNLFSFVFKKVKYGNRYLSSWVERFHPSVSMRLYDKSTLRIARNIEIGKDSEIFCFNNSHLEIRNHCFFNSRLMISCHTGVSIGRGCLFGPDVKIFDNNHRFSIGGVSTALSCEPITIGDKCWIASNVVILKGTQIGNNCVIGAGCVVSGNIPNNSIVRQSAGNLIIEKIKS